MATRFYLPSSGAAAVSPGYNAGWESTSIAARLKAVTTKIGSSMTTVSYDDANTANQDILFRQWVSDPIAAQTISAQTVKLQMRCSETAISNNLGLTWAMYVFSNDGSTLRGTILAIRRDAVEAATSLTDRGDSTTSTEVVASANDRIVIEIGMGGDPAASGSHDSSISIGDDSASDLPANDTETAAYNPWVEFANTITFASSEVTGTASITLDGIGISAAGTVAVAGAGGISLEGVGVVSAGVVEVQGVASIGLDGVGLSSAGAVAVNGAGAVALDGLGLSSAGTVAEVGEISGEASISLEGIGLGSAGNVDVAGAAGIALEGIGLGSAGNVDIAGSGSLILEGIGITSEGTVDVSGGGSIALEEIAVSATGSVEVAGAGAISLEGIGLSAAGTITASGTIHGAANISLDSLAALGTAVVVWVVAGTVVVVDAMYALASNMDSCEMAAEASEANPMGAASNNSGYRTAETVDAGYAAAVGVDAHG